MILLIDAGNSRIKWRLQCETGGRVEAEGALTHDDIDQGRVHFRMDGKTVFENGVARMSDALFESLEANQLALDQVDDQQGEGAADQHHLRQERQQFGGGRHRK